METATSWRWVLTAHPWIPAALWIVLEALLVFFVFQAERLYRRGSYKLVAPGGGDQFQPLLAAWKKQLPSGLLAHAVIAASLYLYCRMAPPDVSYMLAALLGFAFFPRIAVVVRQLASLRTMEMFAGYQQVTRRDYYYQLALGQTEKVLLFVVAAILVNDPWVWGGAAGFAFYALWYLTKARSVATPARSAGK